MNTGKLIVVDGNDGLGKSTVIGKLEELLNTYCEKPVVRSFEPTKSELGQLARDVGSGKLKVSRVEELNFYTADRAHHAAHVVLPALNSGHHVLLDRYYYSTMAYQSAGGFFKPEDLLVEQEALFRRPDLTIILDAPVWVSKARLKKRLATDAASDPESIYEHETFLTHCRDVFLSLAGKPGVEIVSAAGTPEEVWIRVQRVVSKHLPISIIPCPTAFKESMPSS